MSMTIFKKTSRKQRIVILQSLPPGKYEPKQSGEEIFDYIIKEKGVNAAEFAEFHSSEELSSLLNELNDTIEKGQSMVVHFETHGSNLGGISVFPNNETILWEKLLVLMVPISKKLQGTLIVILSMCISNTVQKYIDTNDFSPYRMIVATRIINRMEIIRGFKAFYHVYNSLSNIEEAMKMLPSKTKDDSGSPAFIMLDSFC